MGDFEGMRPNELEYVVRTKCLGTPHGLNI